MPIKYWFENFDYLKQEWDEINGINPRFNWYSYVRFSMGIAFFWFSLCCTRGWWGNKGVHCRGAIGACLISSGNLMDLDTPTNGHTVPLSEVTGLTDDTRASHNV